MLLNKFPLVSKFPLLHVNWEITNSEERPILSPAHLCCACKHTERIMNVCMHIWGLVDMWGCRAGSPCGLRTAFCFWPYRCGSACQTKATGTVWLWWRSTWSTYRLGYAVLHLSAVHLIVLCRALCSRDSPSERRSPWLRCRRLVAALWRCWTSSAVRGNTRAA